MEEFMNASQIKITRDELYQLRLQLALLEKKSRGDLYLDEIEKVKQEIETVRKKMAKQKTELYTERTNSK